MVCWASGKCRIDLSFNTFLALVLFVLLLANTSESFVGESYLTDLIFTRASVTVAGILNLKTNMKIRVSNREYSLNRVLISFLSVIIPKVIINRKNPSITNP